MSHSDDSVSQWIAGLKSGDERAAAQLWERYFRQLVSLARKKLGSSPRRVADEEDLAISAFKSFCQAVKEDRFRDMEDRDDLWQVIVCITERKAYTQSRDQRRQKRGHGVVSGESAFVDLGGAGINEVVGREPTPEFCAAMAESLDRLLSQLDNDELRLIALKKLEGYTNEEIAEKIGRSVPTVERRLRLIRGTWSGEYGDG
jgi:RNA polymerase sigma factor (sigma-70 family)